MNSESLSPEDSLSLEDSSCSELFIYLHSPAGSTLLGRGLRLLVVDSV